MHACGQQKNSNKEVSVQRFLALVIMTCMYFIMWIKPKMKQNNHRREDRKVVRAQKTRKTAMRLYLLETTGKLHSQYLNNMAA